MNETIKEWLKELYDDAIRETKGAIKNERIWANGSDTEDKISYHLSNIDFLEEYIEVLKEKKNELN